MAVSFKLNNTYFPPLPFPSASKPVSSASASLPFITACKPFPHDINIRSSTSFAIAPNTPISRVPHSVQGNFSQNLFVTFLYHLSHLACNILTKHNP